MKQVSKQLLKKLSSVSSKQDKKGRQCRVVTGRKQTANPFPPRPVGQPRPSCRVTGE